MTLEVVSANNLKHSLSVFPIVLRYISLNNPLHFANYFFITLVELNIVCEAPLVEWHHRK